jgi:hypothetical protein
MYGFWGLVVLIGLVNRCAELLTARRHRSGRYRSDPNGVRLWIRKHILLPATFGHHSTTIVKLAPGLVLDHELHLPVPWL